MKKKKKDQRDQGRNQDYKESCLWASFESRLLNDKNWIKHHQGDDALVVEMVVASPAGELNLDSTHLLCSDLSRG